MNPFDVDESAILLPISFTPTNRDVICGWARQFQHHAGNVRFRRFVNASLPSYLQAKTKLEKTIVIGTVVDRIQKESPVGGFVKHDHFSGRWYQLQGYSVRDKVGHALRKAASRKTRNNKAPNVTSQRKTTSSKRRSDELCPFEEEEQASNPRDKSDRNETKLLSSSQHTETSEEVGDTDDKSETDDDDEKQQSHQPSSVTTTTTYPNLGLSATAGCHLSSLPPETLPQIATLSTTTPSLCRRELSGNIDNRMIPPTRRNIQVQPQIYPPGLSDIIHQQGIATAVPSTLPRTYEYSPASAYLLRYGLQQLQRQNPLISALSNAYTASIQPLGSLIVISTPISTPTNLVPNLVVNQTGGFLIPSTQTASNHFTALPRSDSSDNNIIPDNVQSESNS